MSFQVVINDVKEQWKVPDVIKDSVRNTINSNISLDQFGFRIA